MRDTALLEPDALLVRSTREKADLHGAGLHGAGIAMQGGRIVNALEDRLRWPALMKAHLEIAAEQGDVGAIIVGLPGTMLHRLLASP